MKQKLRKPLTPAHRRGPAKGDYDRRLRTNVKPPLRLRQLDREHIRCVVSRSWVTYLWVPKTLAGDFRKFWPVPLMVAPRRV